MLAPVAQAQGADVYGVGGGSIGFGSAKFATFAFSAHTGPQGDFGSFTWKQESPPLELHLDITCVRVFPSSGWLQGPVERVSPMPNLFGIEEGEEVLFYVEDNGEPPDPLPDAIRLHDVDVEPQFCKRFPPRLGGLFISQGNINIKAE
jgi:hypothetical protein